MSILIILTIKIYQINQPFQNIKELEGKLLIWHSAQGKVSNIMNDALDEFEKLNPNVNVILQYIPDNENPSRFILQSRVGFGASAIVIDSNKIGELLEKNLINPIDSNLLDISSYLPSTLSQVRYQHQIYGVPLTSNTRALCYNKAKLSAIADPILSQPPTDLDGLIERAIKGYSVGMVSSFEDTFWGIGAFGGRFFNDFSKLEPNLDGWGKWIDWLKNASTQPNFILERERSILNSAFAQGKLTYYVCQSTEIKDLISILKDDLRVALLPQGEKGKATPLLYTKVMIFNPHNSSKENNLGFAFAKFITNPEQQLQGILKTQSFIPTNRYVIPNVVLLPLESILLQQSKNAVAIPLNYLQEFTKIFEKGEFLYQKAMAGEISSQEGAKQLILSINTLMK